MVCVAEPQDNMELESKCEMSTVSDFHLSSIGFGFEEGLFVLLPNEMRIEIFSKLIEENDWPTLNKAGAVNSRWREEIECMWRSYAERQQLLNDEDIWAKKGKNWKWVTACLTNVFSESTEKHGFGSSHRTIAIGESKYEGEWTNGQKEGVGRMWWHNGDRYLGDWKANSKHGNGFMMWNNGDHYEGAWRQDLRHGEDSIYSYANGGVYKGTYFNDERHGNGEFIWPDGDKFVGKWQAGGRKGKGFLIQKNGNVFEQEWSESPYVNYSDSLPPKFPAVQEPLYSNSVNYII